MSEVIDKFHIEDEKLIIETVQDVEPILEANKRAQLENTGRFKSETFNHKARIPNVIWQKWCNDNGITYHEFMNNDKVLKRFLEDPDNAFCLTRKNKRIVK